jgi:hypothetical protein
MTTDTKDFSLDVAINGLSFGAVSIGILRECYKRGLHPSVFPLQGQVDLGAQKPDDGFNKWLGNCINKAHKEASRQNTAIKLWHLQGGLNSYSATNSRLITFHETDQITPTEINVLKNQSRVYVTSTFTQQVFKMFGVESEYLPLGFDSHNFHVLPERPRVKDVISFGLGGKLEIRKGHLKVLALWAKKYGNKREYRLNCALSNPFLKPEVWNGMVGQALEGKQYYNINFLNHMPTNAEYNQFLQANDIYLAMSGGEGRDLPAYHSVALGAHIVALKAHAYNDYLTDANAVLVTPNGKRPAADGVFFHPNTPFNSGNFFDFGEDDFLAACEKAEARVKTGINVAGLELQKLTYADTVDVLLKDLK